MRLGGWVIHVHVWVCMWRPKVDVEAKGWCQGSSSICFHFIFGEGVLTWTQTSLTWVACLSNILQGSPVSACFVLKLWMDHRAWGSKVQCLYSHCARSHLPSPLQTVKHWSHSLGGYESTELLGLLMSQFWSVMSAEEWPALAVGTVLFHVFGWLGLRSYSPFPLSLVSALGSFFFLCAWLTFLFFSHHRVKVLLLTH